MNSAGKEACLIILECAVETAIRCCIPRLTFDEFIDLAQSVWENNAEQFRQKEEEIPPVFFKNSIEEHLPAE